MKKQFLFILLFSNLALGQGLIDGFFKGKKHLDMALGGFYQHSEKYYGNVIFNYPRTLSGGSLFAAYGIREDLDVVASIPLINGKFQDAGLFIKYCIPHSRFAKERRLIFIPAIGVSFPIINYPTQTGQAIGQRATQIQPKFVMHWRTKFGVYFTGQVGYNYNFNPVPSSISASFKTAVAGNKMYGDFWFDYQYGLGDNVWAGGASIDFRTLHVTYSKIGGSLYYGINNKMGVFVNGSYILGGVNVGNAYSVGAGFVYKLDFNKETNQ